MARFTSSSNTGKVTKADGSSSGAQVGKTSGVGEARRARRRHSRAVMTTAYKLSYSSLATLSIIMLALVSVGTVGASKQTCSTNNDCTVNGTGKCVQRVGSQPQCVYSSCKAGFFGASATYADCRKCPEGMTSIEGKAFYSRDCFLPCGDARCYTPEDGYAECIINAKTARHECLQTCNQEDFVVLNPGEPYASCLSISAVAKSRTLTNQHPAQHIASAKMVRMLKRTAGKRLRASVNLHNAPAAALMEDAGSDMLALVSK